MQQPRRYYSQHGEDCLLWSVFDAQPRGFFIDVGAFDGVHLSNTLSFEQQGWKGICIDAHPVFIRNCARNRRGSLCLHAACVAAADVDRISVLIEPLGLLSGIHADRTPDMEARYANRGMKFPGFAKAWVPARSLDRILSEHLPPDTAVDFLSIDVEGTELDVLRGLDLERYSPRVIVAEANTAEAATELTEYLAMHRYLQARQVGPNYFFAREASDLARLRGAAVECRTELTLHPSGESATLREHVGKTICLIPPGRPCDNVLRQEPGQPLYELLSPYMDAFRSACRSPAPRKFAHIVHTYDCPAGSVAEATQKFTFQALGLARASAQYKAAVDLISVPFGARNAAVPPPGFRNASPLTRTVLDVHSFRVPRQLPLLFDILESGLEAAGDAESLIFTNSDICPMPHFYEFISRLLDLGFDTLIVNRRATGTYPLEAAWQPLAQSDYGAIHPGFDCFVFPAAFGRRFLRSNSCVGAPHVMRSLLLNLVALSTNMLILTDVHATYHIGTDDSALRPELEDYFRFNRDNANEVLRRLSQEPALRRRLQEFCTRHHEFPLLDPDAAGLPVEECA